MANRYFQTMQALEQEVKEGFAIINMVGSLGAAPSGATTTLTNQITYTAVDAGSTRNGNTITIQVLAAAANPTNTVLVAFGGTSAATSITVTPNNGDNNGAVAVNLTTAQLVELINTGAVVGKTITLSGTASLRTSLTATGGGAQNLADGGEGDGAAATLAGGYPGPQFASGQIGLRSVSWVSTGRYAVVLAEKYVSIKSFDAVLLRATAGDITFQLRDDSVSSDGSFDFISKAAGTATNLSDGDVVYLKLELKNQSESL